jgi:hypothetical protein
MMHYFFLVLLVQLLQECDAAAKCERLKTKQPVTYTQDEAPRDLSGVVWRIVLNFLFFSMNHHPSSDLLFSHIMLIDICIARSFQW